MERDNISEVRIKDINMPFLSMVIFMVKWSIAAIPAMIILFIMGAIFTGIFGGFLGTLILWESNEMDFKESGYS